MRGVPANLFSIAKKELLTEMIDGLSEDMSVHNPDIIYEKVASMSCKAAVKGHHTMSFQEANVLIDQLLDLENPVSYTHLTLPTNREVQISVVAGALQTKRS